MVISIMLILSIKIDKGASVVSNINSFYQEGYSEIHSFNKSMLPKLMGSKTSVVLLKFLQSTNMKKTTT